MVYSMILNSYEVINLTEEIVATIIKCKRYKVLATTPMEAVEILFPDKIVLYDCTGMGSVVVKGIDCETEHTYNLA